MRNEFIGIISEGVEDQGVLRTILRAFGFDGSEIKAIRPDLGLDATDRHNNQQTIGTIQGVKNSCIGVNGVRADFDQFFALLDCNTIVVQMDTAEIEQNTSIVRPTKSNNSSYSSELRELVIHEINEWLEGKYKDQLLFAITIEEMEAWCLTIFETNDTTGVVNSKDKLTKHLNRNNLTYRYLRLNPTTMRSRYFEEITKKYRFHKLATLKGFAEKNQSLKSFVLSLEERFKTTILTQNAT